MSKRYYYYSFTNTINNKKYCGITINPANRYPKHIRELKNNCHHSVRLQNAVNKYGLDAFEYKIEYSKLFDTIYEAYEEEKLFIAQNNAYLNGYNMTAGGFGISEETAAKIRATSSAKFPNIYQIDPETMQVVHIYSSLHEVERTTTCFRANVSKVCHRQDISAQGYYWCFDYDWSDHWIPPLNQKYKPIALVDKEDGLIVRVFASCAEAGRQLSLDRSNIRASIARNGTCGGNKFKYITIQEYEAYACRD